MITPTLSPLRRRRFVLSGLFAAPLLAFALPAFSGTFTVEPLTGDSDSHIAADAAYTHAINIFDIGNLTINGAVFTGSGGGGSPSTNDYTTTGLPNGFPNNTTPITGAVGGLMTNFLYNGNPEVVTLNNLRVGQQYVTTFYNAAFGVGPRNVTVSTSDGGNIAFDQNALPGSLLNYAFTASSSTMAFTFTPQVPSDTFHQYAFSNRILGQKALLTDNFYAPGNPNTGNVNFNLAARQGGSLVASGGPITYTPTGNTQVGNPTGSVDGGNYLLSAFGGSSSPNHNFNGLDSAGGLSISFDAAVNINGGNPEDWAAINIGFSDANRGSFINRSSHSPSPLLSPSSPPVTKMPEAAAPACNPATPALAARLRKAVPPGPLPPAAPAQPAKAPKAIPTAPAARTAQAAPAAPARLPATGSAGRSVSSVTTPDSITMNHH